MRTVALLALTLAAPPALAWEFSPLPICTMTRAEATAEVIVTHDPVRGEYAISVTLPEGAWPAATSFSIAFVGAAPLTISTARHVRSGDGCTITVRDTGFGNVLTGMAGNEAAVATAGAVSVLVPLDGAAAAVEAFRACPAAATA